jgi:leader peptidase (prepilin peptidase)/N-methyltransferase
MAVSEITFLVFISLFGIGVIIGSFLNVILARLRTEETILGRSYCRSCRRLIAWFDNIPLVSYFLLRGKCRKCKDPISPRYPLVETGMGLLFLLVGIATFSLQDPVSWSVTLLSLGVVTFSLVIALYDAKYYEIPMTVLWVMVVYVLAFLIFLDFLEFRGVMDVWDMRLHSGVLAGFLGFGFFYLLSFVSKERWMGYGDAYVAFVIGLVLGGGAFFALLLAFIIGAFYGVGQMIIGKKTMKSQVPFAPFLLLGLFLVMVLEGLFGDVWKLWVFGI